MGLIVIVYISDIFSCTKHLIVFQVHDQYLNILFQSHHYTAMSLIIIFYFNNSFLGVFSSFFLLLVVLYEGLSNSSSPGSITAPSETEFVNIGDMGVSLGLLMVCYAGHAILPNIYFSMRDPSDFPRWALLIL